MKANVGNNPLPFTTGTLQNLFNNSIDVAMFNTLFAQMYTETLSYWLLPSGLSHPQNPQDLRSSQEFCQGRAPGVLLDPYPDLLEEVW